MANYLLAGVPFRRAGTASAAKTRNPLKRLQRGFEHRFETLRGGYRGLLVLALDNSRTFTIVFLAAVVALLRAGAVPGPELLPQRRVPVHPLARACADWNPHRGIGQTDRCGRKQDPRDHPAGRADDDRRQHRHADQRHQLAYGNSGTIGVSDADILISLNEDHAAQTAASSRRCASGCRATSRHDVLLPAGRHHQPDSQFRSARPHRCAGHRAQHGGQPHLCRGGVAQDQVGAGHRRSAHPAGVRLSDAERERRPHARPIRSG